MSSHQRWLLSALAAAALGLLVAPVHALTPTLITMDDLSPRPLNGLVHPAGVTFGFTLGGVPSNEARYASGGPGETTFIDDPSVEGPTSFLSGRGAISMQFALPAVQIEFGLAMSAVGTRPNAATVELYDAANVLFDSSTFSLTQITMFSEAQYKYVGTPVTRALLKFNQSTEELRFAFDNLLFAVVPEPASIALAAPLLGLLVTRRRRDSSPTRGALHSFVAAA
jgi:hypothetical protein